MVDFSQMKTNKGYSHRNPIGQFTSSGAKIACDVVELAELQVRLFRDDMTRAARKSAASILMLVMGIAAGLASLPVIALGLATALSRVAGMELWSAQLIVGFALCGISLTLMLIASRIVTKFITEFQNTSNEMSKNVSWIKDVFRESERPTTNTL